MNHRREQEALWGLRIGCVQYLNSRPLMYGLSEVRLAHPRVLAEELRAGRLDVALVPVFEWLRDPGAYVAVDGFGVASRGPVMSVFLAYRGELEGVREVVVDPASLTSVHLLQVLFRGVLGRSVSVVMNEGSGDSVARLWIGNQALGTRLGSEGKGWKYWDLGEVWTRWTGLPFVYALWVMRSDLSDLKGVATCLRSVGKKGLAAIDSILSDQRELPLEVAREYLRERIWFEVGLEEKSGLKRFRSELRKAGFFGEESCAIPLLWA